MIPKIPTLSSTLGTAVQGLQRAEAQVAQATNTLQQGFTAAQNTLASTDDRPLVPMVEDAMRAAVLPTNVDIVTPLIDLLQATTAYRANAAVVRVTADVEATIIGLITRR
jgi:flagellar basal body rod protein FlgG